MRRSAQVTAKDLGELIRPGRGPHVSMYLPAHASDASQDVIRLKNLLKQAEAGLQERGFRRPDAAAYLSEIHDLLGDAAFWRSGARGIGIFVSLREAWAFRLPAPFEEIVTVGENFHVKPLLPMLAGDARFSLLALSRSRVRLLQGDRYSLDDMTPVSLPTSLEHALEHEVLEKQSQVHTAGPPKGAGAQRTSIYHGHGATERDETDRTRRFLRVIEAGIGDALKAHGGPLVLAGVDEMRAMYREINTYAPLVGEGVHGSPDAMPLHELHDGAIEALEPHFRENRRKVAERFLERAGTGLVSTDLREVLSAAQGGRVDTLFVAQDGHAWGASDPVTGELTLHDDGRPGDEDLLDRATAQTLLTRGRVFVVAAEEVPGGREAAALLRY